MASVCEITSYAAWHCKVLQLLYMGAAMWLMEIDARNTGHGC